jgi:hypothetical protein
MASRPLLTIHIGWVFDARSVFRLARDRRPNCGSPVSEERGGLVAPSSIGRVLTWLGIVGLVEQSALLASDPPASKPWPIAVIWTSAFMKISSVRQDQGQTDRSFVCAALPHAKKNGANNPAHLSWGMAAWILGVRVQLRIGEAEVVRGPIEAFAIRQVFPRRLCGRRLQVHQQTPSPAGLRLWRDPSALKQKRVACHR